MNYFPEETLISLVEVPGEISLIIPIAGCGHFCKGCHSPHYQNENNGEELTEDIFLELLKKYKNKVSCICFFGGEHSVFSIAEIAKCFGFKIALYSGYEKLWNIPFHLLKLLDYLKLGEYNESLGGLESKKTNQRMYKFINEKIDITKEFWRNND